jgi:hypothetical protein
MGYTTDFVGHLDIEPGLNQDETEYLTAFARSRRFDRVEGPYAVPGNPAVDEYGTVPSERYNRVAPGQPQLWCQWVPCWDGCCLSFDGHEKFYAPDPWLTYLIDHFLRPGAHAASSGLSQFEHFTFDHHVDGMVIGCRRDTKELFAIVVENNRVATEILRPGGPDYFNRPPLPYEIERDREDAWRRRRVRGRRSRSDGQVVRLDSRR